MKANLFSDQVRRRMANNHLRIILPGFIEYLKALGYAVPTIGDYRRAVEHFGRWLRTRGRGPADISRELICLFLQKHLPHCHCPKPASHDPATSGSALHGLMAMLEAKGISPQHTRKPLSLKEQILDQYDRYLVEACGVAKTTHQAYRRTAQELMHWRFEHRPLQLQKLTPKELVQFVTFRAKSLRPLSLRAFSSCLRSFLRFLQLKGYCSTPLDRAVPKWHAWNRAQLPTVIDEAKLRQFIHAFDRSTAMGRRDYAMALCMCELGLRVSEVAQLSLDDLDWRQSTLQLSHNKQRREHQLPLPRQVAQALANYIRRGRPSSTYRQVFLRHRSPVGKPLSVAGIRWAIRHAYDQVGIAATGTHLLRRTFATRLHQRGVSLKLLADLRGHKDMGTAAVYARVNLQQLQQLALPWPKGSP